MKVYVTSAKVNRPRGTERKGRLSRMFGVFAESAIEPTPPLSRNSICTKPFGHFRSAATPANLNTRNGLSSI